MITEALRRMGLILTSDEDDSMVDDDEDLGDKALASQYT